MLFIALQCLPGSHKNDIKKPLKVDGAAEPEDSKKKKTQQR